jgi:hypothetical protein
MASREQLVQRLWPDKLLYASVLLLLTGGLGALYGLLAAALDLTYSAGVPDLLRGYPPLATVALSAATAGLAYMALRRRSTKLAFAGGLTGVLAMGLLGLGPLLSLAALVVTLLAWGEREDRDPETLRLTADMWPDKSLAASLVLLLAALVNVLWALVLLPRAVVFEAVDPLLLGLASLLVAVLCLAAAAAVHYQRWPALGALAAAGSVLTLGLYLVGPVLGLTALALLLLARGEREFLPEPAGARPATGPAPAARGPARR